MPRWLERVRTNLQRLGFGKGFVAGCILGTSIGVVVFALVPVLVLAACLGVALWFNRKVVAEAKRPGVAPRHRRRAAGWRSASR